MRRREFVKGMLAIPAFSALAKDFPPLKTGQASTVGGIADDFMHPTGGRLITLWQWMNGCVTREGITYDLESFKKAGITGVQQFLVGGLESVVTDPEINILNEKWMDLMQFALSECQRLGLDFGTHNCPGWSSSGITGLAVEDSMQKLVWSGGDLGKKARKIPSQPEVDKRWNYYQDICLIAVPAEKSAIIPLQKVVVSNSTALAPFEKVGFSASGWQLLRFGHTTTGQMNLTAPISGQGLEVDKMNKQAVEKFWKLFPGHLVDTFSSFTGTTFKRLEIDSYEAGEQTWTPDMVVEFRKRRGYDLLPWLPVLAGYTIESKYQSQRFLEDWHGTISELVAENYYQHLTTLTQRVPGMEIWIEPYGTNHKNFDALAIRGIGDVVMCEFWWGPTTWGWDSIMPVASNAHVNGKRIVAAEAFTGQPQFAWKVDLYDLKAVGDKAFCEGVNLFVLHASAHQPWPTLKPGMTMGWWGTQFGPSQTWWHHGAKDWITYVKRCQILLQEGHFAADLCYLHLKEQRQPEIPAGYKGDVCNQKELETRFEVSGQTLVLPDGMAYRILVLPQHCRVTLPVAKKILRLVMAGATVIGSGFSGVAGRDLESDSQVKEVSVALFGSPAPDSPERAIRTVGKGKVYSGYAVKEVLDLEKTEPDFEQLADEKKLRWIHRKASGAHFYFISNQESTSCQASLRFRVTGMQPEIWNPETGTRVDAPVWSREEGHTSVQCLLGPSGSLFIVFRSPINSNEHAWAGLRRNNAEMDILSHIWLDKENVWIRLSEKATYELKTVGGKTLTKYNKRRQSISQINDHWTVFFQEGLGAPKQAEFPTLISWPEHLNPGIKYFSGTARYARTLTLPKIEADTKVFLDLGVVKNVATVHINGIEVQTLWKPPFLLDITPHCTKGHNSIEIDVTNLWPNRMIGDENEPEDGVWGEERTFGYVQPPARIGRNLLEIPTWVASNIARPTKRITFCTMDFFNADSPLMPSGLMGPVQVITESVWNLTKR